MPSYPTADPAEALDQHVRSFFAGHSVTWRAGPARVQTVAPGFGIYEVGPGPRFTGWTYVTSGCWAVAGSGGGGLEFVLSADHSEPNNLDLVSWTAFYHCGSSTGRFDLGHTVPIGTPWHPRSVLTHLLIAVPYAYGPALENCQWDGGHARLLAMQPISRRERDFKRRRGLAALEQRFDECEIAFSDPHRPSAVRAGWRLRGVGPTS